MNKAAQLLGRIGGSRPKNFSDRYKEQLRLRLAHARKVKAAIDDKRKALTQ